MKPSVFRSLLACASLVGISSFAQDTPTPAPAPAPSPAPVVAAAPIRVQRSVADVVKLAKGRVSGEVLLLYIKSNRAGYSLSADEILYLKQQNVPDEAITEMLNHPPQAMAAAPSPVPVEVQAQPQPQVVYAQPQQQPTVVQTAPQVTYVSPQPVYVYDSSYYSPYYSSYWWSYPAVSLSFGFGRGYYGHSYYGRGYYPYGGGHYNYVHNYSGGYPGSPYRSAGFNSGFHGTYSRGGGGFSGRGGFHR